MGWGGGVIGWQVSRTFYESHSLSGRANSNDVGCLYSSTYSAVVYRLHRKHILFCTQIHLQTDRYYVVY